VVLVDQAAEDSSPPDRRVERDHNGGVVLWRALAQALVRAVSVEVREVFVERRTRRSIRCAVGKRLVSEVSSIP
jgi:hypothetical protein